MTVVWPRLCQRPPIPQSPSSFIQSLSISGDKSLLAAPGVGAANYAWLASSAPPAQISTTNLSLAGPRTAVLGALKSDGSTLYISVQQEQNGPPLRDAVYIFDVGSLTLTAGPTLTGWTTLFLELSPDDSLLVAATVGNATADDVTLLTNAGTIWKIDPATLTVLSSFNPAGADWTPRGCGILSDASLVFAVGGVDMYLIDPTTWSVSVTEPVPTPEAGATAMSYSGKIAITSDDATAWVAVYGVATGDTGTDSHWVVPYDIASNTWGAGIKVVDGTINHNDQQALLGSSLDVILSDDESALIVSTMTEGELRLFDIGSGLQTGSVTLTGTLNPWRGHGLKTLDDDHLFVIINFQVVPISKCFVPQIIRRVY